MRAEKGEGVIPDIEFKPGFVRRMMGLVLGSTLLCNQPPRVVRLAQRQQEKDSKILGGGREEATNTRSDDASSSEEGKAEKGGGGYGD